MRTYKGIIRHLAPNQVFVFGSNREGRHGKGAALAAKEWFGAVYGQARGPQGRCYAIITKDLRKKTHPSVSMELIIAQIGELYEYAKANPDEEFMIAYSGRGTNLNGYSNPEMAAMFSMFPVPENICFEEEFGSMVAQMLD